MKFNKILGSLALTALVGASLSSCSNDMDDYGVNNTTKASLVNKAPKIKAYSGNHLWGQADDLSTYAGLTRAGAQVTSEMCSTTLIDREYEGNIVDEYLPEKNENLELHPNLDSDFLFYADKDLSLEFYPVYSQTSTPNDLGVFYWDKDGNYNEVIVWEAIDPYKLFETQYLWSEEKGDYTAVTSKGVKINVPEGCTFGFYWKGHAWKVGDYSASETIYYSASNKNVESYCTNGEGQKLEPEKTSKVHAVTFQLGGKTYLGLEDWTDFDYQDWVFTCDQELQTVDASTFEPGSNPGDNKGGNNGDDNGDDDGDDNGDDDGDDNGDDNNGGGSEIPTPPVVAGDDHTNEVEVNLAVDTKGETSNGKYNESHTSIHVRSAVDVDLFIPMPLDLICPADDMEIVKKHLDGLTEHGGEFKNAQYDEDGKVIMEGGLLSKMTYEIKDATTNRTWTVAIYVEYVASQTNSVHNGCKREFTEEGIHIWTEGLEGKTDLFDYLQETYGDGITFEIWNYYDKDKTFSELKEYLDQATIDFIGETLPDFFINAFGSENFNEGKDCNVSLVEDRADKFDPKGEGAHLNGSEHNKIYENKTRNNNTTGNAGGEE